MCFFELGSERVPNLSFAKLSAYQQHLKELVKQHSHKLWLTSIKLVGEDRRKGRRGQLERRGSRFLQLVRNICEHLQGCDWQEPVSSGFGDSCDAQLLSRTIRPSLSTQLTALLM